MAKTIEQKTSLPAGRELKEKPVFLRTIALAWELGYSIAVPLVVLAFFGRFLDKKYALSSPIFLLSGILLAIIVSGFMVFKKTKKILDDAAKQ